MVQSGSTTQAVTAAEARRSTKLGLVAGLGVGASVFYYRSLVDALVARKFEPQLVMVHADVRRVMDLAEARDARTLAAYLADLLDQLASAGAEVATIPAFSPQVCAEELEALAPLPMISLLDAIAAETARRELRRVAIFGAQVTMRTELFGRLDGVSEVVSLPADLLDQVGRIYRNVVERETASATEIETLRSAAHQMIDHRGVEAVILAGTDFSFVFGPANTDFPHLDGARTHIDEIIRVITNPTSAP
jgi:aspartate racemase